MAKEKLLKKQKKIKCWFDKKTESREFCAGDQVLAFLPLPESPFWSLYCASQSICISTPECKRRTHLCHANLLKPFYNHSVEAEVTPVAVAVAVAAVSSLVTALPEDVVTPDDCLFQPRLKNSETR